MKFYYAGTKPDVTTETQREANKGITLVALIVKGDFSTAHVYCSLLKDFIPCLLPVMTLHRSCFYLSN